MPRPVRKIGVKPQPFSSITLERIKRSERVAVTVLAVVIGLLFALGIAQDWNAFLDYDSSFHPATFVVTAFFLMELVVRVPLISLRHLDVPVTWFRKLTAIQIHDSAPTSTPPSSAFESSASTSSADAAGLGRFERRVGGVGEQDDPTNTFINMITKNMDGLMAMTETHWLGKYLRYFSILLQVLQALKSVADDMCVYVFTYVAASAVRTLVENVAGGGYDDTFSSSVDSKEL